MTEPPEAESIRVSAALWELRELLETMRGRHHGWHPESPAAQIVARAERVARGLSDQRGPAA